MAVSSAELERVDAELDALGAGIDLEAAWAAGRSAAPADLEASDRALVALGAEPPVTKVVVAPPPRPAARERAPSRRPPARAPSAPPPVAPAARASVPAPAPASVAPAPSAREELLDPFVESEPPPPPAESEPVLEVDAYVEAAPARFTGQRTPDGADAILNPFEEPAEVAEAAAAGVDGVGEDERTLIIDASEFGGGLDMDALFDGMVEDALSAPLDGVAAPAFGRASRPITDPPLLDAHEDRAPGATDIEQLRPEDDELELFVDDDAIGIDEDEALEALEELEGPADVARTGDDDPGDGNPKKKGFFKKLFG